MISDQTGRPNTVAIPSRGNTYIVDTTPLRELYLVGRENELVERSDQCCEFVPDAKHWATALTFLILAGLVGSMVVAFCARFRDQLFDRRMPLIGPMIPCFVLAGAAVVAVVLHLCRASERFLLDRQLGWLRHRLFFRTVLDRPLRDVVAVQAVPSRSAKGQTVIELNLVLTGAPCTRLNVQCKEGDPAPLLERGRWLSAFLEVPLLEQLHTRDVLMPRSANESPPGERLFDVLQHIPPLVEAPRGATPTKTAASFGATTAGIYGILAGAFNRWNPFDPSMAFFGMVLYAAGGGLVGALLGQLVERVTGGIAHTFALLPVIAGWFLALTGAVWLIFGWKSGTGNFYFVIPLEISLVAASVGAYRQISRPSGQSIVHGTQQEKGDDR